MNDTSATDVATTSLTMASGMVQEKAPIVETDHTTVALFSQVLLFIMTLGLSATVEMKILKQRLSNPAAIVCGVSLQYLLMPVLGALTCVLLAGRLSPAAAITLLVLTSSPGGSYSTWWCATFNADLALSVALTTVSSLLGVFLLPANLWLWTHLVDMPGGSCDPNSNSSRNNNHNINNDGSVSMLERLDTGALLRSLAIVILAIVLGLAAGAVWDTQRFRNMANRFGNLAGVGLVILGLTVGRVTDDSSIGTTTATATTELNEVIVSDRSALWNQPWPLYMAVVMPCVLGILLPTLLLARSQTLTKPEVVAIAIEVCYQNNGIATSVAISMFHDAHERAQALAVPIMYGLTEATLIFLYCLMAWKAGWTKAPPSETLWNVLTQSFEGHRDYDDADGDYQNELALSPTKITRWTKNSGHNYLPIVSMEAETPTTDDTDQHASGIDCHVRKALERVQGSDHSTETGNSSV